MNKDNVKAEILNLCGEILMGKADEKKVREITKLACDNGLGDFLRKEFLEIGSALKDFSITGQPDR